MVFSNLRAEIARNNFSTFEIAEGIGISHSSLSNKMRNRTEFTRKEMMAIRKKFFPYADLIYLFELEQQQITA